MEHLPVLNALCRDDPEQKAGTIHAANPEHLPIFKAPRGHNPEQNAGKIHASNLEHLLVFKALRGDPLLLFDNVANILTNGEFCKKIWL